MDMNICKINDKENKSPINVDLKIKEIEDKTMINAKKNIILTSGFDIEVIKAL